MLLAQTYAFAMSLIFLMILIIGERINLMVLTEALYDDTTSFLILFMKTFASLTVLSLCAAFIPVHTFAAVSPGTDRQLLAHAASQFSTERVSSRVRRTQTATARTRTSTRRTTSSESALWTKLFSEEDMEAGMQLADMYRYGRGAKKNINLAFVFYKALAEDAEYEGASKALNDLMNDMTIGELIDALVYVELFERVKRLISINYPERTSH